MIDKQSFKSLQKKSASSFAQQKNVIKKLLLGQPVACQHCKQALSITLPSDDNQATGICCPKGCTDVALDFS
ncbi:hypothetical protein [Thalassotalea sp. PLHSN55]|uniref:hypothetical protein n=1 Tax=Thalassotalea sp. PLHSN55 TaxID=3435888 RepID=UPI003F85049F